MDDDIEQAARDLLDRRGEGAIDWLNERIGQLQAVHDSRSLDTTYRILSVVERLLRENAPR
ncbi:MAG: hypothetical protein RBS99_00185 [Rhodospirillales bacterium]|jgi:hypothetical protein|nr:hypothetical protein [Rhodospirillales bacterium]